MDEIFLIQSTNVVSNNQINSGAKLTCDDLKRFKIPIPPHDEQDALLEATQAETREIAKTISRLEREITFLLEYRTRLIADVVTGKLDVREAAAQLPDLGQELHPLDKSEEISDAEEDDLDVFEEATEDAEP